MSNGKDGSDLDELGRKIEEAKAASPTMQKIKKRAEKNEIDNRGLSFAVRIGTEFVAALLIGVGIGYVLDTWLDTKPLFLIIFFLFGSASGFMNVYRVVNGMDMTIGYKDQQEKTEDEEQDKTSNS
ncbi:AtpZ/AtpI family protein [Curvivirga aplysinae]|uniref:AtpZ/AtpI family protein n=1 Tax=Curvivirga aplysinae TaxID=2529852 RepID=UPI001C3F782C|nr:AtpZ/AtpI family protein [Curvivirga aplysinae]